jgi:hypothetical protein
MRKLLLVAALVVLPSVRAQSQDAPIVATWDSVFRATFDAYDGRDWRALAREADPRALEERKGHLIEMWQQVIDLAKAMRATSAETRRSQIRYYEQQLAESKRSSPESLFVRTAEESFRHADARRPIMARSIIGHAAEGDSLVHVVFRYRAIWEARPSAAHRERTVVDVLTLRRTGDHWRAMLNGGLLTPLWDGADMMNAVQ